MCCGVPTVEESRSPSTSPTTSSHCISWRDSTSLAVNGWPLLSMKLTSVRTCLSFVFQDKRGGGVQIECFCSMILWTSDKEAAGLNPNSGSKLLPLLLGLSVLDLVSSLSDGTQTEIFFWGGGGGGRMAVTLLSQLGKKISEDSQQRQLGYTAYYLLFCFCLFFCGFFTGFAKVVFLLWLGFCLLKGMK